MAEMNFVSNLEGVEVVPESYVCPPEKRPDVAVKKTIPVLDFATHDRALLFQKILDSTHEFGFFQVINHGVPKKLVEETMSIFMEFHSMSPYDKRRECSKDNKSCRVFTSSNNYENEQTHFWRDCLALTCHPLDKNIHFWPQNPPKFREVVRTYCVAMEKFSWEIIDMISEGLGLEKGYLEGEMSSNRRITANHYPICPNPSLTLGLNQHCDRNLITILFQDANGLQVFKDGHWISFDSVDDAFLINFGYLFEVISNGKLKATEHRVVTNAKASRQSLGYFIFPENDVIIEPAKCLINEANPARYRSLELEDFYRHFFAVSTNTEETMKYILA
ncbi:hyoscyamine 6-dioxygenase-like [Benincasa hispida]|uniref:hyoscyamine 6-dioxygenase-like n=1 Tax=Benincasa hispida TaxID=102211 RepID=UPI001901A780|nr:hyoscyamine 6-dioxygenase-like [Benincasa hispida]